MVTKLEQLIKHCALDTPKGDCNSCQCTMAECLEELNKEASQFPELIGRPPKTPVWLTDLKELAK